MRERLPQWGLCGLLFLATTLNYLDRQAFSILAPILQRDLRLDNADLGWLLSVFYWTYTLAQFGVGPLLDRWHLRWAYGFAVLAWSAAAALTSLATGFASLIVFRMLLGLTESVNWPAAMRMVARALPPQERSLGNGLFTSGTSIGALIAPALVLGVAQWYGWRWGFVVVGSFGAAWFLLWVALTGSPRLRGVWRSEEPAATKPAYGEILAMAQFWRVFAVSVLVNPCLYFCVNWLPTYFVQQRGLRPDRELGWVLTLIFLGLDAGYLLCGALVLLQTRRGTALALARRRVFLLATACLALCAAVPLLAELRAVVAVLVVVNFGVGAWISMYLTMAQEVSPAHVSTAAGLLGGSGSLAGALAMWAVGMVTQRTGSFAMPMGAVALAAVLAALAGWLVTHASVPQPSLAAVAGRFEE